MAELIPLGAILLVLSLLVSAALDPGERKHKAEKELHDYVATRPPGSRLPSSDEIDRRLGKETAP